MSDKIADHARRWLNGPLPADLMADLADIVEDDEYDAEKRSHQVVWQALKWMIEEALDANYGAEMLRALVVEREAERKRAEKAEAEKKTYESGWLEAEGIISDLQKRAERAESERDRLHNIMRSIILILRDADERGQGVAWQNAMDMAQHAIERGLDE